MLWFAAPPMYGARAPVVKHSLRYLAYLARKRRERDGEGGDGGEEGEGEEGGDGGEKGGEGMNGRGVPTVSEMMDAAMDVVRGEVS